MNKFAKKKYVEISKNEQNLYYNPRDEWLDDSMMCFLKVFFNELNLFKFKSYARLRGRNSLAVYNKHNGWSKF